MLVKLSLVGLKVLFGDVNNSAEEKFRTLLLPGWAVQDEILYTEQRLKCL